MGSLKEPLLPKAADADTAVGNGDIKAHSARKPVAVDLLFLKRVCRLMVIAKAGGAIVLVVLSVLSVIIVSRAGLVIGRFYLALIDKDLQLLSDAIQLSLLWYGAESVCSAAQVWTAELLALQWRRNLTEACHTAYLKAPNLCALNSPDQIVDNPDERVTQELYNFSQRLTDFLLKTIAAPLMILYYTWWVWKYVGWYGPVSVYIFFAMGATVTRWIISPIAGLVARQEKLEAFFRIAHVRVRRNAESIAMYNSGRLEQTELENKFESVLDTQRKLVTRHFLLDFVTKAYGYLGSILNYCVVGLAVFGGRYSQETSGDVASLISNASFSVLQLIFSFTQIIETAKMVSDLAGYTVRVAELFEALNLLPPVSEGVPEGELRDTQKSPRKHEAAVKDEHVTDLSTSSGAVASPILDLEEYLVSPPLYLAVQSSRVLEVSIHFCPLEIQQMLAAMFPEVEPGAIMVVTTFQHAAVDLWPMAGSFYEGTEAFGSSSTQNVPAVEEELNTLLNVFLGWQHQVTSRLKRLGHWADAVHPWKGLPISTLSNSGKVSGPSEIQSWADSTVLDVSDGPKYRQVGAASLLLGYPSVGINGFEVLDHPKYHTRSFPASLFTTAPLSVLLAAIRDSCDFQRQDYQIASDHEDEARASDVEEQSSRQSTQLEQLAAMICDNVTVTIPRTEQLIVKSLSTRVRWGESLLITGPTGSGKTSLLRAIGGIWPLQTGGTWIPPRLGGKGVLFIPQTPLLVKGGGLAAQICYPGPQPETPASESTVRRLEAALQKVGMTYLLHKVKHDWQSDVGTETLSPGEQQSLSLARILYHRPQLAIMDEATSALNEEAEDRIYNSIMQLGITVVSVAHRRNLLRYHTHVLHLPGDGKGSWALGSEMGLDPTGYT